MGKFKDCLLFAAGSLVGIIAGFGYGRMVQRAPDLPMGSNDPVAVVEKSLNSGCCDTSKHKTIFVTVEPDVQLEVLDWGGKGTALVLLTGLGDNAHVYDEFAHQFTDAFHVIGITRRGFGQSSQPAHGYDIVTRARDDIAVLDQLGIRRAIFVGHSVAGTELNQLAANYPDRVEKLVYLDALDLGSGGWASLPQPPPPPEEKEEDLASVQRFSASMARSDGYQKPLAAICNLVRTDSAGRIVGAISPPDISSKISAGFQPADYDRIRVPTLGIFNRITPKYRLPYYWYLSPASQEEFDRSIKSISKWSEKEIRRFREGVKNSRVIELQDENHYMFIVNVSLVTREMRRFLIEQ